MKINFKNYKAFSDGSIELRPLTFLLGANSSGKSSIQQLILMLEQTINNSSESYKSALKLNGHYVNLGEGDNVFKDKNAGSPLEFEFQIDRKAFFEDISSMMDETSMMYDYLLIYAIKKGYVKEEDAAKEENIEYCVYSHYKSCRDRLLTNLEDQDTGSFLPYFIAHIFNLNLEEFLKFNKENFQSCFRSFRDISSILRYFRNRVKACNDIYLGYTFCLDSQKRIQIDTCYLRLYKNILLKASIGKKTQITSENVKICNFLSSDFSAPLFFRSLEPIAKSCKIDLKEYVIEYVFKSAYGVIKKFFKDDAMLYVSPLRACPQRYYMLDESAVYNKLDSMNGVELAEILKQRNDITEKINKWLVRFGLEINISEFKDVIHKIIVKQDGLTLDITDVGFGLSQVLPILVQGFISAADATILIEQPEIHLHPKMQAELMDLFLELAKGKARNQNGTFCRRTSHLVIETHSEYILKRLRRRIIENKVDSKDVAIYFVEPRKGGESAKLKMADISNRGEFNWPSDFYDTEFEDDRIFFTKLYSGR